jgi:hypothetical protein
MNLHGSVREAQNTIVRTYLELEQRFNENGLIRESWNAMAHDVFQQIQSLNALPQSFWNQLKADQASLSAAITESIKQQSIEIKDDRSLKGCFDLAFRVETPAILKIYVPLIRKLRENLSAPALDFYIMVKAHLARITRVTESFSGDPVSVQRAHLLLQTFEKEVQEPHIEVLIPATAARSKEKPKKSSKIKAKTLPSKKPAKILRHRAKPLVKKVSIARRRARR